MSASKQVLRWSCCTTADVVEGGKVRVEDEVEGVLWRQKPPSHEDYASSSFGVHHCLWSSNIYSGTVLFMGAEAKRMDNNDSSVFVH